MEEPVSPAPGAEQNPAVTDRQQPAAPPPQNPALQPAPAPKPPAAGEPPASQPAEPKQEPAKPAEFKSMLGDVEKPAEKQDGQEGEDGEGKPDTGDFDIAMPEGFTADKEAVGFLMDLVKSGDLSKEKAQELANQHVASIQRYEAYRASEGQKQIDAWEQEIRDHPQYGGIHLEKTVENCKLMLQKYGSPKLIQDFNQMGVLSHPEFCYMLARLHEDVSDGVSIGGAGQATPETSAAKILFPNMN